MGNGIGKITVCFTGSSDDLCRRPNISLYMPDPLNEGHGHSFCYVQPDPTRLSSSKVHSEEITTFKTIFGTSVSANASTPLSTALLDLYSYNTYNIDRTAAFESSTSFASIPLQPIPCAFSPPPVQSPSRVLSSAALCPARSSAASCLDRSTTTVDSSPARSTETGLISSLVFSEDLAGESGRGDDDAEAVAEVELEDWAVGFGEGGEVGVEVRVELVVFTVFLSTKERKD